MNRYFLHQFIQVDEAVLLLVFNHFQFHFVELVFLSQKWNFDLAIPRFKFLSLGLRFLKQRLVVLVSVLHGGKLSAHRVQLGALLLDVVI